MLGLNNSQILPGRGGKNGPRGFWKTENSDFDFVFQIKSRNAETNIEANVLNKLNLSFVLLFSNQSHIFI